MCKVNTSPRLGEPAAMPCRSSLPTALAALVPAGTRPRCGSTCSGTASCPVLRRRAARSR